MPSFYALLYAICIKHIPLRRPSHIEVALTLLIGMLSITLSSYKAEAVTFSAANWARPGAGYATEYTNCSVGFPATDDHHNRYFFTAGHCFYHNNTFGKTTVYGYDPLTKEWDDAVGFLYIAPIIDAAPIIDVVLIKMHNGKILRGGWDGIPIDEFASLKVGAKICAIGYVSGKTCGKITHPVYSHTVDDYHHAVSLLEGSTCLLRGDSGGPVYSNQGAIGINLSISDDSMECNHYYRAGYTSIKAALKKFRTLIPSLRLA